MAITYASPTEGATAVAALTPSSTLIASFQDGSGRARTWVPAVAPVGGTTAAEVFPSITSVSQVLDSAGSATGPVILHLAAGSSDTVDAASVLRYTLDQNVSVVTVSGSW